uniref:Putative ovule protein n=1 Tax=Solanum chacoense TaxID=4108 RepID=A0A0V0GJ10_SOLCH
MLLLLYSFGIIGALSRPVLMSLIKAIMDAVFWVSFCSLQLPVSSHIGLACIEMYVCVYALNCGSSAS